jgi:hypothetical protein
MFLSCSTTALQPESGADVCKNVRAPILALRIHSLRDLLKSAGAQAGEL